MGSTEHINRAWSGSLTCHLNGATWSVGQHSFCSQDQLTMRLHQNTHSNTNKNTSRGIYNDATVRIVVIISFFLHLHWMTNPTPLIGIKVIKITHQNQKMRLQLHRATFPKLLPPESPSRFVRQQGVAYLKGEVRGNLSVSNTF